MLIPRRKIGYKAVIIALLVALGVHFELLLSDILPNMYDYWNSLFPRVKVEDTTEVTLVSLSQRDWEENRQIQTQVKVEEERAEEEELAAEEEKEEKDKDLKGQVVDVAPTPDKRRPDDAKYLSEHNTRVEKESVSRNQRKDYGVAQPRPTVAEFQRRKPSEQLNKTGDAEVTLLMKKQGQRETKSKERAFAMEYPDIKKRQSLQLKLDLDLGQLPMYSASEKVRGNSERLRMIPGKFSEQEKGETGEEGKDKQNVAQLGRQSLKHLDMVTGAPANDYLKDAPKGEETLLNSKEFRYATFFNRVKRGVSDHWNPGEVYIRHDPYGNIYGVKDRYTVLNVVLGSDGELSDVTVARSSGVGFLDDEAVHAFQLASPFPNPPQGLMETDGLIRFQFGFFFEIGDRPKIRAFRFRRYP
ncbi:energy transducer TonB [Myxococcota bacterium]